jgi:hypothetical protein
MALMQQAAAQGQYATAAAYERQRNAKLSDLGRGNEVTSYYYDSSGIGGSYTTSQNVDLATAVYGGTNPWYPVTTTMAASVTPAQQAAGLAGASQAYAGTQYAAAAQSGGYQGVINAATAAGDTATAAKATAERAALLNGTSGTTATTAASATSASAPSWLGSGVTPAASSGTGTAPFLTVDSAGNSVTGGTIGGNDAKLAFLDPIREAVPYLNAEGVAVANKIISDYYQAVNAYDSAALAYQQAQATGDTAAMQKAKDAMQAARQASYAIAQNSSGIITDPGYANGTGRTVNAGTLLYLYGDTASNPASTMTGGDPATASYPTLAGSGFDTTSPTLQQNAYPINYQFGGANASDPVGSSNLLEQQVAGVTDFNQNAQEILENSPEYQAQMKLLNYDLLRAYQNMLGTQSGSSGVAGTNTASALGQMMNQAYADMYALIPEDLANLYGRAVTGYNTVADYENSAYAKGADTRDYDTALYQWQYGQNKDNFLTDREFQYLLNRDWISDQRYADETEWNRALAERQQAFNEWANTYKNADGTPLSAAEYEQAQQAFENSLAVADYERLAQYTAAQIANMGSSGSGSGSGSDTLKLPGEDGDDTGLVANTGTGGDSMVLLNPSDPRFLAGPQGLEQLIGTYGKNYMDAWIEVQELARLGGTQAEAQVLLGGYKDVLSADKLTGILMSFGYL